MGRIQQVGHEFYGHNRYGLFPNLESLSFRNMKRWQLRSNVDANGGAVCFPRLKKLSLTECPSLKGNLPVHVPSLVELEITGCVLLRRLLPIVPSAHVPVLQLETFPFPRAELPKALVVTSITYLSLERLASLDMESLPCFQNLYLHFCQRLLWFPGKETGRGEATTELSAPNLATFEIDGCEKVKPVVIEKEGEVLLPELRGLTITNSATGELPHAVRRSLLKFSCLKCLTMEGLEVECFPVTGEGLPTSLTRLIIKNFRKLRKLDGEAFHCLKYLTKLCIWECPELERFPEKGLSLSLKELEISGCPKLEKRLKPHKGKD
ncbi:hypothetical protein Cgig2_009217 [Carnegiea gigantea]|uniref:Uncharacterized protein n=1 Tax=Carnegiea gigantea TaxID=171969 RepID=A0A9Q1JPB3_9CARY|nr:hypothetical protein Cgig2_009217 [Carnegiea gigantea]